MSRPHGQGRGFLFALLARCEHRTRQCPEEKLIAHSDRGVQYASEHYRRLLTAARQHQHSITCSMSRKPE